MAPWIYVFGNGVEKASLAYLCSDKVHTYLNDNRPVFIRSIKTFIVALLCGHFKIFYLCSCKENVDIWTCVCVDGLNHEKFKVDFINEATSFSMFQPLMILYGLFWKVNTLDHLVGCSKPITYNRFYLTKHSNSYNKKWIVCRNRCFKFNFKTIKLKKSVD